MRKPIVARRALGVAGLLAAAALGLTSCASPATTGGDSSDGGQVVYTGWGGSGEEAMLEAWFKPFTEETGIEVVVDSPVSLEKATLMTQNGNVTWDIIQYDLGVPGGTDDNALLEQLDCEIIACADFESTQTPATPQAVPAFTFSYVNAYNTNTYPDEESAPQGLKDFFDVERFPGQRMLTRTADGFFGVLEAALIADGVSPEELYPLDVDRALAFLEPIKEHFIPITDDSECITNVASGEAVMGFCYNGRAAQAIQDGLPVGIGWGGQVVVTNYHMVVKGSPNAENAMKLIAWMSGAQHNADLGNFIAYGSVNPQATPPEGSPFLPFLPSVHQDDHPDEPAIYLDSAWWGENREDTIARVLNFVQGG